MMLNSEMSSNTCSAKNSATDALLWLKRLAQPSIFTPIFQVYCKTTFYSPKNCQSLPTRQFVRKNFVGNAEAFVLYHVTKFSREFYFNDSGGKTFNE